MAASFAPWAAGSETTGHSITGFMDGDVSSAPNGGAGDRANCGGEAAGGAEAHLSTTPVHSAAPDGQASLDAIQEVGAHLIALM